MSESRRFPAESAPDRLWHRTLIAAVRFRAWLLGSVYTAGALAIVSSSERRILLVRPRYRAGWGLPGGYMRPREQPAAALRRELAEEVGLDSPVDQQLLAVYVQEQRRHIDHLYLVEVTGESDANRTARYELADARWFDTDALPPLQPEALAALQRWSPEASP